MTLVWYKLSKMVGGTSVENLVKIELVEVAFPDTLS